MQGPTCWEAPEPPGTGEAQEGNGWDAPAAVAGLPRMPRRGPGAGSTSPRPLQCRTAHVPFVPWDGRSPGQTCGCWGWRQPSLARRWAMASVLVPAHSPGYLRCLCRAGSLGKKQFLAHLQDLGTAAVSEQHDGAGDTAGSLPAPFYLWPPLRWVPTFCAHLCVMPRGGSDTELRVCPPSPSDSAPQPHSLGRRQFLFTGTVFLTRAGWQCAGPISAGSERESDEQAAPAPALPLETGIMQLHRLEFYYEKSM